MKGSADLSAKCFATRPEYCPIPSFFYGFHFLNYLFYSLVKPLMCAGKKYRIFIGQRK